MTHSSLPQVLNMQCGRQVLQDLSWAVSPLRCQMGKLQGMGFEVRETYITLASQFCHLLAPSLQPGCGSVSSRTDMPVVSSCLLF